MTYAHAAGIDEIPPRTAYALWQLRSIVFVLEQDCVYLDLDGRDLEAATQHLWLEDEDGAVLAYLRVLDDGDTARIGRVVTHPAHRGQGLAAQLMGSALDLIGDGPCVLDAQSHLATWYGGLGFEVAGEDFIEDGIPHTPMRRITSS